MSTHLAYIVLAHKNPEQLVRMVHALDDDGVAVFLHIDRKTPAEVYDVARSELEQLPNVVFLRRHKIEWGTFGNVRATLEGIDEIVRSGFDPDYVMLLTGQDYPIKPAAYIKDFLTRQDQKCFFEHFRLPNFQWTSRGGLERIERWHWPYRILGWQVKFPNRYLNLPIRRRFPPGYGPYGGGAYWCWSRPCFEYVHQFVHANPRFVSFFKRVFGPDEIMFNTIVLNSPFAAEAVNDDLRYIVWPPGSYHPKLLGVGDVENLAQSTDLFARKFDVIHDSVVLDLIDRQLLRRPASVAELSSTGAPAEHRADRS